VNVSLPKLRSEKLDNNNNNNNSNSNNNNNNATDRPVSLTNNNV